MKRTLKIIAGLLMFFVCFIAMIGLCLDARERDIAADDEAGELTFSVLDSNDTLVEDFNDIILNGVWYPPPADITIATDTGNVELTLLGLADCNDVELSRFADFLQIAMCKPNIIWDPNVYGILVNKLISPKLIKEKPND